TAAEGERLVHVVHQRGHFAEPAAQQLLNGRRRVRIRFFGLWELDLEHVDPQEHGTTLSTAVLSIPYQLRLGMCKPVRPSRAFSWLHTELSPPFTSGGI